MLLALKSDFVAAIRFRNVKQRTQYSLTYAFLSITRMRNDIFNMPHRPASNFCFKHNGTISHNLFTNSCDY